MRKYPIYIFHFIILLALSFSALAESSVDKKLANLHKGIFVIASDHLDNSSMRKVVIYLIQHDDSGHSGVIVNRPTNLSINEAFPETHASDAANGQLFFGGPLHTQYLFMLTQTRFTHGLFNVDHDICFGTGDEIIMRLQAEKAPDKMKTFAGFFSWGPGQLETEITNGDWIMAPATAEAVLNTDTEELWDTLYKRWAGSWI